MNTLQTRCRAKLLRLAMTLLQPYGLCPYLHPHPAAFAQSLTTMLKQTGLVKNVSQMREMYPEAERVS